MGNFSNNFMNNDMSTIEMLAMNAFSNPWTMKLSKRMTRLEMNIPRLSSRLKYFLKKRGGTFSPPFEESIFIKK